MAIHKRKLIELLKERDGLTCGICKQSLEEEWKRYEEWLAWAEIKEGSKPKAPYKRSKLGLSIDHIYPRALARDNGWPKEKTWSLANLQLAHMSCNTKKGHTYGEAAEDTEGVDAVPDLSPAVRVHPRADLVLGRVEEDGGVPLVRSETNQA